MICVSRAPRCRYQFRQLNTFDFNNASYCFDNVKPSTNLTSVINQYVNPSPSEIPSSNYAYRFWSLSLYSTSCQKSNVPSRSLRRRISNREKARNKPVLDLVKFDQAVGKLPPRFNAEELHNVMVFEDDPLVCLELFNWASQQPRFRHDVPTYHVVIKKLGAAKMYEEMDGIVNLALAVPNIGSEALFNSMIYFFTSARKLTRAVMIYKHMKDSRNLNIRPTIRTYNLLFAAFLGKGSNSYVNHMYMETIRCLFKQMVDDGVEPDIFSLNTMIKGYVLSLHVNDGLRIFHQMGVVFKCFPNAYSYDYLIHGLCAQNRTNNARELFSEMRKKGFAPSSKSYNSFVNALALAGEVDDAVSYLWEMIDVHRAADFITCRTILDEICRKGKVEEAQKLLRDLQDMDVVDGYGYRKLLHVIEDDFGSAYRNRFLE